MDTFLLRLHQRQIEHQCKAAILALNLAQRALNAHDQDAFWGFIQTVLTASGNIAKALWGQGGKLAAEREAFFRHFDPETGEVIFWGEHYSLIPLRDALTTLLPVVAAEARKPHWDGPPRPQA